MVVHDTRWRPHRVNDDSASVHQPGAGVGWKRDTRKRKSSLQSKKPLCQVRVLCSIHQKYQSCYHITDRATAVTFIGTPSGTNRVSTGGRHHALSDTVALWPSLEKACVRVSPSNWSCGRAR